MVGGAAAGSIWALESRAPGVIDLAHGAMWNLRNSGCIVGGLSGGMVVVAVVGTALAGYGNDGTGSTCTLVVRMGSAGTKLGCGAAFVEPGEIDRHGTSENGLSVMMAVDVVSSSLATVGDLVPV